MGGPLGVRSAGNRSVARRNFLVGAGANLTALWLGREAQAATSNLDFEVWRSGCQIGRHMVAFTQTGGTLVATIEADMRVAFGPVTLFRYAHHCVETWRAGRFAEIESHTTTNGKVERVSARAGDTGMAIVTGTGERNLDPGALPLTHWRRASLEHGVLFNPQTGDPLHEIIASWAADEAPLAGRGRTPATRYTLEGSVQLSDWYDPQDVWVALHAKAQDGSMVEYRRRG